ncbi:SIS domain-containing protein [Candidatus Omnitrophota bacterium]
MRKNAKKYFGTLKCIFDEVVATGPGGEMHQFDEAVDKLISLILKQVDSGGKLLFIGNGASAAISSHMATDFWKNGGVKAVSFNDSSLLTCISNDYGYRHVFEKPIEMFADSGDILFAISSSGMSENIIRGVRMARSKGCRIVTLSGFAEDNPLRSLGDLNFYVPYSSYGPVEIVHHSICHCTVDNIIQARNGSR